MVGANRPSKLISEQKFIAKKQKEQMDRIEAMLAAPWFR